MTFPWYTDAEIDDMCEGLVTNAAKAKHLRGFGITVNRKPNGRPLVIRAHAEAVLAGLQQLQAKEQAPGPTGAQPNRGALIQLFQKKREVA